MEKGQEDTWQRSCPIKADLLSIFLLVAALLLIVNVAVQSLLREEGLLGMAEGKETGMRKEWGEVGSGKAELVQKQGVLVAGSALQALAGNSCSWNKSAKGWQRK